MEVKRLPTINEYKVLKRIYFFGKEESLEKMSRRLDMSPNSVQKIVKKLIDKKLVKITKGGWRKERVLTKKGEKLLRLINELFRLWD